MRSTDAGSLAALAICLFTTEARAHGIVGARSFIEPFVTEDVNPKNELVIARPEIDWSSEERVLHYGFGLEKRLADSLSVTLDSEWLHVEPKSAEEESESGFDNLGITLKYAFWKSESHEAIASFGVESTAPTGSKDVDVERDWSFKPFVLYGKGFGDVPDAVGWLRPFAVQGDFGPEVSTDDETTTAFAHDIALQYSLPYLQASVRDVGLSWPLANLLPVVELNFEHALKGEETGSMSAVITPGLVYMDSYVELGAAGRFPLNDTARGEIDPGVIFIVDLFIDDIFPWTRWQPIGGPR